MPQTLEGPLTSRAPLMDPNAVAEMLGVNVHYVYRSLNNGDLKGYKIGGRPKAPWRVRVEDVEAWANA